MNLALNSQIYKVHINRICMYSTTLSLDARKTIFLNIAGAKATSFMESILGMSMLSELRISLLAPLEC